MIADTALARPPRHAVLHPVAREYLDAPVVHGYGKIDYQLPLGLAQYLPDILAQVQEVGCRFQLLQRRFKGPCPLPFCRLADRCLRSHPELLSYGPAPVPKPAQVYSKTPTTPSP